MRMESQKDSMLDKQSQNISRGTKKKTSARQLLADQLLSAPLSKQNKAQKPTDPVGFTNQSNDRQNTKQDPSCG
jgi:hypothetical protein